MKLTAILSEVARQVWAARRLLIGIDIPICLLFIGIGILTKIISNLSIPELVSDVATIGKLPFYSGAVSQIGLLIWSSSVTIIFFAYFSLKLQANPRKEALNFLLYSGCLTAYVMLDDTFMLHEEFFSDYLMIISEEVVLALIGLAMILLMVFHYREILQNDVGIMAMATVLFVISIAFDFIPKELYQDIYLIEKIQHLLEDGAKLAAIVTWTAYYARYSYRLLLAPPSNSSKQASNRYFEKDS